MLVGMLYERRHTRLISEFGGLATSVPVFSTFFLIVTLSSLGLPMLNGFVGEFLIIVGSYYRHAAYAAFAAVGVVLAAVYLLWMYQRVFYGKITNPKNAAIPDCDFREKLILTVAVVVIIGMGIYPQPFLRRMDNTVTALMMRIENHSLILTTHARPPSAAGVEVKNPAPEPTQWPREAAEVVSSRQLLFAAKTAPTVNSYLPTYKLASHRLDHGEAPTLPSAYCLLPTGSSGGGR
jgi:NADH-quinone oxidoreductase subunit M